MRDLKQRTKEFALRIIRLCSELPHGTEALVIRKQLVRSGTSVGAHYREAARARSNAEFVSKLGGGHQELEETSYWLELLAESRLIEPKLLTDLINEADELSAIFTTCIKNARQTAGDSLRRKAEG